MLLTKILSVNNQMLILGYALLRLPIKKKNQIRTRKNKTTHSEALPN